METVFGNDYSVLIGQNSLLENVVDGIGEIYKIHGCSSNPNSIVITKSDYDNFYDKSKYLNAKLLTLFLEYPIIFLGYSISDRNIINILSTIVEMLSPEKVEELKSRIWFIEKSKSGKDKKSTARITLNGGHYLDISSFKLQDYGKLYSAISDISTKRIPLKFLKYLKGNIYELIASQEYNPKLLNVNIEDLENIDKFDDASQFVRLTFSTERNIGFCNNTNICEEFLEDKKNTRYDKKDLLQYRKNNFVPFYKFLQGLTQDEILENIDDNKSSLYKQVVADKVNYKIDIGKEQTVDYHGKLDINSIEEYATNFVVDNCLQKNQQCSVIRYVLLQLINRDIAKIIASKIIINEYGTEIVKVMTHLSREFIRENKENLLKLARLLSKCGAKEHNFRFLLCHIDRSLYREESN